MEYASEVEEGYYVRFFVLQLLEKRQGIVETYSRRPIAATNKRLSLKRINRRLKSNVSSSLKDSSPNLSSRGKSIGTTNPSGSITPISSTNHLPSLPKPSCRSMPQRSWLIRNTILTS
jgi:hypothetical protein